MVENINISTHHDSMQRLGLVTNGIQGCAGPGSTDPSTVGPSDTFWSSSTLIADYAKKFLLSGRKLESDLLYRIAFAHGETSDAIDAAIDSMTKEALEKLKYVELIIYDGLSAPEPIILENFSSEHTSLIRNLFENRARSLITLMDVVELMDIASPLAHLQAIELFYQLTDELYPNLQISGIYQMLNHPDEKVKNSLEIDVNNGYALMSGAGIYLSDNLHGLSIGAQYMLLKALFAKRYAINGWKGRVSDDGILVWPCLGAKIECKGPEAVISNIMQLVEWGVLDKLDIDYDPDVSKIAKIKVDKESLKNEDALRDWLNEHSNLSEDEVNDVMQNDSLPLGMIALNSQIMSAHFDTTTIISTVLDRHMSRRVLTYGDRLMERGAGKFSDEEMAELKGRFFETFRRGRIERDLYALIEYGSLPCFSPVYINPVFAATNGMFSSVQLPFWNASAFTPTISNAVLTSLQPIVV